MNSKKFKQLILITSLALVMSSCRPVSGDVSSASEPIPSSSEPISSETPSSSEKASSEQPSSEMPSSETPSSETQSSEVPSSEQPISSEIPSSEQPVSSDIPSSEQPVSSDIPSSEQPVSSEVPSSETPSSEAPSSEVPSSEVMSSEEPSSELPSSEQPSSEPISSELPSSEEPSSETPSSETPSSEVPSSEVMSSEEPSSELPSSEQPSSEPISSELPSSEEPSSETPSSEVPSSEEPSSETPSSEQPSSEEPSSEQPSSEEPSSETSSSEEPSSEEPSSSEEQKTELEKMNEDISGKNFIDPFEVRDYLISLNYDFTRDLGEGMRYGYSVDHAKVVIYQNNAVIAPENCIGDEYVAFNSVMVNSYNELKSVVDELNNGNASYSTIKLGNDITQTEDSQLIQVTSTRPLEIDLNGHTIYAPTEVYKDPHNEKWFTLQFLDKTNSLKAYVHGGTIEANRTMKVDGVEDDSCALSLAGGKTFRLNNLSLIAKNGTQCVGDLSQYINANMNEQRKKVYISDVTMTSPLRAMSIAGGEWYIDDVNIVGMVVIDGGKVVIDHSVVDASTCSIDDMNKYTQGYTNSQLAGLEVTKLNGKTVNTTVIEVLKAYQGAVTFNDAITVVSRRSAAYTPADVTVTNSTLTPVIVNNVVTGYGFRYWDVAGFTEYPAINPTLSNNTYPYESGGFGISNF